ncbi:MULTISPECIES: N-acetylmuramate alpha-1-phosphate uridylyltransferase MurU [Pseudoxanthomonas]|uniref:Nucleotidyltransferase family protein n=1 Tax=Pseudoxanthomonas winnipegensis TaxID=2480810 RepID=A0A4Q8L8I8_9GAMM|nr:MULTISPECIES: nucleotidyltransferase family protein [Pseudoxanthomonas]TAA24585.1 nucleotidyltransferase family protein [Pseudoxanthomonas winnipegensis]TMN20004.1 nucleotidyltransferase family protein [Pseudoxanthomonas sp. X-1]UAY76119.1 nucleotidyltransferase family protein [Pseudoxanthomonas sp. X-1]
MKALLFCAGLGERMRPLTDHTPKPLLEVGGTPLIVWHLRKLAAMGIGEVVINLSWLADQFPRALGDGSAFGVRIAYSHEGPVPLETGGGMLHALSLLGEAPFLAVNGDVWTDFDFAMLPRTPAGDAHLVMIDNPPHHPRGDFRFSDGDRLQPRRDDARNYTYSGIGVYRPAILRDWRAAFDADAGGPGLDAQPPRFPLAPLLRAAMTRGAVTGQHHAGRWTDVGTPQRLAELDAQLRAEGVR